MTFVNLEDFKMAVVVQYVVKPNPGSDAAAIVEMAKEGAVIWRKHGGKVSYWSVAVGEVGNFVFSVNFELFFSLRRGYGKVERGPSYSRLAGEEIEGGVDHMGTEQCGDRNSNLTQ